MTSYAAPQDTNYENSTRRVVYLGGDYNTTNSGHVLQNQIYIAHLTPAAVENKPYPLIMPHSRGISGLV